MKWQEARKHYPDEWLLIEAIHAHSVNDKRILDDLAVLNAYDNSAAAMYNRIIYYFDEEAITIVAIGGHSLPNGFSRFFRQGI